MNKIQTIFYFLAAVLTIFDILARYLPIEDFDSLIKPRINILEIVILLTIIGIVYNLLPNISLRRSNVIRSKRLFDNWKKFKLILQKFSQSKDENLQNEYEKLREKIEEDFNYFAPAIKKIQESTHRGLTNLALRNFENTFCPRRITEWQDKVGRKIPEELDCFDYILISLKEYYKKSKKL